MAIGNVNTGKRFKSLSKTLKEFKQEKEIKELWYLPSSSQVDLTYHLHKKRTDSNISSPLKKNITVLPDLAQRLKKSQPDINLEKLSIVDIPSDRKSTQTIISVNNNIISKINELSSRHNSINQEPVLKKENMDIKDDRGSIKMRINFFDNTAQKVTTRAKRNSKTYEEAISKNEVDAKTKSDVITLGSPIKKVSRIFDRSKNPTMIISELEKKLDESYRRDTVVESEGIEREMDKTILDSEIINYDVTTTYEPFCKAFFIASLPKKNAKMIPDSEDLLACCNHYECSIFPSYKPEIISRYPIKDIGKLEINSLVKDFNLDC
jgi:hypothetical protein